MRLGAVEASEQRRPNPLALGDSLLDVEPRLAQRRRRDPRRGAGDRRGRAPRLEHRGDSGGSDRVADTE